MANLAWLPLLLLWNLTGARCQSCSVSQDAGPSAGGRQFSLLQTDQAQRKVQVPPRGDEDAKTTGFQPDADRLRAGSRAARWLPALLGRPAADRNGSAADGAAFSALDYTLAEFGLTVLLGCACVVGVTIYQVWYRKMRPLEIFLPTAFWQVMIICLAVAVFIVEQFVSIPACIVVFALGTLCNTALHCKDNTLVTALFRS